jgi:hypothetical protein
MRSTRSVHLAPRWDLAGLSSGPREEVDLAIISTINREPMGYIQELEAELTQRLARLEEHERRALIRFVKEKLLESFKNGLLAAKMADASNEAKRESRRFGRGN